MKVVQTSTCWGCQGQVSMLPCCRHHCPTGGNGLRSEGGSTIGRWRGDQGIAAATMAAPGPWVRPPTRGAWLGAALAASDREGIDATCRSVVHDGTMGHREGGEGGEGVTVMGRGGSQEREEDGGKVAVMPSLVGLGLFETFVLCRILQGKGWRVHAVRRVTWTRSRSGASQGIGAHTT